MEQTRKTILKAIRDDGMEFEAVAVVSNDGVEKGRLERPVILIGYSRENGGFWDMAEHYTVIEELE